ncbi:MAG TPA: YbdD/YjiX family protein [Steroidobacteraceae bacterium]|nr:YbdD/YjiX family protein [Steroidobacteraceae bacterium]
MLLPIKLRMYSIIRVIRRISGDDAYERYVQHYQQHHADDGSHAMLDRRAFYLAEQQRKWNGVKRCC